MVSEANTSMHPRFAERLAKRYVELSKKHGKQKADTWIYSHCKKCPLTLAEVSLALTKLTKKA